GVGGDHYRTLYASTGASPEHLLGFTRRSPLATVVRLEENYRSTPEILDLANRLAPRLGGARKTLRSNRPSGPPPIARAEPDENAEVTAVVEAVRRLQREGGVPLEEIAVLYRINARSEPFEEAFAAAGIPYQVRDGAFLRRPGPRAVLQRLKRSVAGASVADAVATITDQLGSLPRLLDGELPFRSGRAKADPQEERRLLYVGITRARRYLFLTWPVDGRSRPSPFLDDLELSPYGQPVRSAAPGSSVTVRRGGP